ncbi:MAG: glycogen synthase GlgA [Clostridiales bacterium]|nr:glycogen synthase GlgA [Clostridiales bacterium]
MKRVLFVTSEAVPYIKTGGLADVAGTLPGCFDRNEYDVRIIMPKYACMDEKYLPDLEFICHFYVDLNWRRQYAGIYSAVYEGITYYFVDNEFYFAGDKPYNNIYEDVEKFAFFSKAAVQCLPYIDFAPHVIHCHDWQTGLVPVFLKTSFGWDQYYYGIKTVFTIHNLKFQGRWKLQEVMDITGLPSQIFNDRELEAYGEANYLKGGVVYADAVTTVSPTYAADIRTKEGGEGLDGLFNARSNVLSGILNGVDYREYDPQTDPYIDTNYNVRRIVSGKKANKAALQKEMGLPRSSGTFLIGMVSRMTDQKGFDLVDAVLEELLGGMDVQLVVLGVGERRYEDSLSYFKGRYPDKAAVMIGYSDELAHRIYASCDAFLMPSMFEPCGLSQMMAMRYGTVPIVRETGGLKDTVEPYNEYEGTGTGFSFANYNAHELLATIRYAHSVYSSDVNAWRGIIRRAMAKDYSWKASAKEYEQLYNRLCD